MEKNEFIITTDSEHSLKPLQFKAIGNYIFFKYTYLKVLKI